MICGSPGGAGRRHHVRERAAHRSGAANRAAQNSKARSAQIDKLKGYRHEGIPDFNEVFGGSNEAFRLDWLVPTPVMIPEGAKERLLGYMRKNEALDDDDLEKLSGAEVLSMIRFGAAAVFAGGNREPNDAELDATVVEKTPRRAKRKPRPLASLSNFAKRAVSASRW